MAAVSQPSAPAAAVGQKAFNDKVDFVFATSSDVMLTSLQGKPMEVRLSNMVAAKGMDPYVIQRVAFITYSCGASHQ